MIHFIYGSLLLLSIAKVATAGPLPTKPVVDVRLDRSPSVDNLYLPSTGQVWHYLDDSIGSASVDYNSNDVEFISTTDQGLTLRPSGGVAIAEGVTRMVRRKVAPPKPNGGGSSVNTPGGGMQKAGQVMGDVAKVTAQVGAEVEGIPIIGEILGTALEAVTAFLNILSKVFSIVGEMEKKSAEVRGKFTTKTVEAFLKVHPQWNVVVAYQSDEHVFYGQGEQGKDWSHQNTDTHTILGQYKYDIYGTHAGIFILKGDGGFQNWAYMKTSQVKAVGDQNHRLIFSGPPPKNTPKGDINVHLIQYNKGNDGNNKNFDIVAIVYIGPTCVGFSGDKDLGSAITITSQLHDTIIITATNKNDKYAALDIAYKGKHIHTDSNACKMGDYDWGRSRQGDCKIGSA
ncbi:hypothetical protein BT96DRAFT_975542 [Gymnopus androsaceus JB14]|uniref:Uncharacterized protein n=1 Tax=Gymnopus androsaceus JB14 TaxID=1447944 RepID=A0A6A4HSR5_9AGAR|nr:hypothetical protein BT96DRAFT_975542 [Gymnopus androsaceus JB14]